MFGLGKTIRLMDFFEDYGWYKSGNYWVDSRKRYKLDKCSINQLKKSISSSSTNYEIVCKIRNMFGAIECDV